VNFYDPELMKAVRETTEQRNLKAQEYNQVRNKNPFVSL
jgi:hypothetical protein